MEPSIPAHEYAFLQDPDAVDLKSTHLFLKRNFRSWFWIASVCIGFGFVCGVIVQDVSHLHLQYPRPKLTCSEPITRREWRSLSQHEKLEYIAAVQCLSTLPSSLGLNQTLHHDFPYIHSLFGNYSHGTVDFLPWHRYFLHIYEANLRDKCGYRGHLAYWDWTLDWEDLRQAPVWDTTYGFGGNGNSSAKKSVAFGHCLTEGPFANLELLHYGSTNRTHRHCLSRGFLPHEEAQRYAALNSPEYIERILRVVDYEEFFSELEFNSHNAIPGFVRGDFYDVTAPNDPVFYLHHTQLDRLWWKWQQRDIQNQITSHFTKDHEVDLKDIRRMGDLAVGIQASTVLRTESELLCYIY